MKAVVFDMDGLIFNTEDVYTLVGTDYCAAGARIYPGIEKRDDGAYSRKHPSR